MRAAACALGASAAFLSLGTGCATTEHLELELSQLRSDVRRLEGQLASTKADLARVDGRVTLLAAKPKATANVTPASDPGPAKMPNLPVVRLPPAPDDAAVSGESGALDDGRPPLLLKLGPNDDPDKLTVDHGVLRKPDPVLGKPRAKRADPQSDYDRALETLRDRQQPAAARALFTKFERDHPDTHLTDNAAFWKAECSFVQGAHTQAIDEFLGVVERYPKSNKIPDALVRVAKSWQALGNTEKSVEVFERIVDRYPESDAATTAREALGSRSGRNGS